MTRIRKIGLSVMALLLAICLGTGLASCGGKDTTPTYGYGEEGTYYSDTSEGEYLLTLRSGTFVLSLEDGTGTSGTYEYAEGTLYMTYYGDEEATECSYSEGVIRLTWSAQTVTFLRREYYTVTFSDGSSTITTQSVLNGKAATDPGDAEKDGYVFLGWYADSSFTTRYEFNTAVTADTTVYARFVEIEGTTEYKITYDFGNGETLEGETLNGRIYDLPEAEMSGYTFIGWWVSATNSADELTYRYTDETLCEDTTLYVVYASGSYIGASIKDGTLTWLSSPAGTMDIYVEDEEGNITYYSASSTSASQPLAAVSGTGRYTIEITSGGVTETLVYVSNGLSRVSNFTVISGSILMYGAVENAERYYITIECGTEGHNHTMIDNGSSLYYDFSSCDMPATGITFTVVAFADGYVSSESAAFNYFLGLDKAEVTVENGQVTWERVALAQGYEVYIDGTLVATTSDTSWSLSGYGTGTYEIAVRPVTTGYYSEKSEAYLFTKTTLAAPKVTGIENYVVSWTEVDGAAGYKINIGGVETTVEEGITSLYLTEDNYIEGLDSYEISVKALAEDSANDSPYGESITVTGTSVGSAVSYENGIVTWQYSLSASEYRITVNDGDELIVIGTNSASITLTKSGDNEITIYFVDEDDEIYGMASITVYAYAIVFDARGGTAYLDGEPVDTIYVAKGDIVTLPDVEYTSGQAEFIGWYTLPDVEIDPDKTTYDGGGVLYEDGTIFTGNSTIVLYAFWVNQRLNVRLETGMGTLTDESGESVDSVLIPINGSRYTVAVPECDDKAYVFLGWYSRDNGKGTRYTDGDGNAVATFSDDSVTTLYAYWIEVFTFSVTTSTYDGGETLAVEKGADIDLVSEVTVPETYTLDGTEWTVTEMTGTAFSNCSSLRTINIPDTITYIQMSSNGYESGSGVFASTALENVNVYATGEPTTTREIIYYSEDGVLFQKTASGDASLMYYPYGRTDASYTVPETVSNENEYELSGSNEVPVTRFVTSIGDAAFRGHTELTHMVIPEYITTMGSSVFYGCTALRTVEFECVLYRIEDSMFYNCTSITEFEVPVTVTEICDSAFRGCTGLTDFTIPGSVETVGEYAFRDCSYLRHLEIGEGVETIGQYAFSYCTSLLSVSIPSSLETIPGRAFYNCESLQYVDIAYGVETIGTYAFYYCTSLVSIEIPASVKTIETYAFNGCSALTNVTLHEGLESIGTYVFYYNTSLTSIEIPSTVKSIGDRAFYGCSRLASVTLSEGLESLGQYAFRDCTSLTSIYIPSTLKTIGTYTFYGCSSLSDVTIAEGVETIAGYMFQNCYSIITMTIPSTVAEIGSNAFNGCYKLVEVCNLSTLTITAKSSNNGYVAYYAKNVYTATSGESHMLDSGDYTYIYDDDGEYYLVDYGGSDADVTLPDSVEGKEYVINDAAFYGSTTLQSITIPSGVTAIGDNAFYNCTALASATLSATVKSIGENAFRGCSALLEVTLPEGLEEIGGYAFYQCTKLASVTIPSTVGTIGTYSFYGCSAMKSLTISEGVKEIGTYAFYNCSALTSIVMPSSVRYILDRAFYGCSSLKSITLNEGLETISQYAFYQCSALTEIVIPSTVTIIGDYAFYQCSALSSVNLPDGIKTVGQYVFAYCSSLVTVVIPYTVESLGNRAFYQCTSLEYMVIPSQVTSIGQYTFYGCGNLSEVILSEGLTTIGQYAFESCYSLISLTIPSTVTSIGNYAFEDCYRLVEICNLSNLDITAGSDEFGYVARYAVNVYTATEGESHLMDSGEYSFVYDDDGNYYMIGYDGDDADLVLPGSVNGKGYAVYDAAFYGDTSIKTVTVPFGVTGIGSYAFCQCTSLTSVSVSSSVVSVGERAFNGCSKLASVTLSEGLEEIGAYAFYQCTSLESIEIPSTVPALGSNTFYGCTSLVSITFNEGLESIGQYAFQNCTALVDASLPDGLKSIGNYAFYQCTSLKEIIIPASLNELGNSAFAWCSSASSIFLPEGLETTGTYAFQNCTSVATITIPSTMKEIGNYAFYNCYKLVEVYNLSSLDIKKGETANGYAGYYALNIYTPDSGSSHIVYSDDFKFVYDDDGNYYLVGYEGNDENITLPGRINGKTYAINDYAFYGNKNLKSVTMPTNVVTSIGAYAFATCSALASVTLSRGLTTIGRYAFQDCNMLTSITIPATVTSIADYAFQYCYKLAEVYNRSSLLFNAGGTGNGYVAYYAINVYSDAEGESHIVNDGDFVYILEDGVYYLLGYVGSETDIVFPDGVNGSSYSIYKYAFYNRTDLTSATFSEGVVSIGQYAFYGCTKLGSVTLSDGLTSIGNYAFRQCSSLTEIIVPSTVTSVGAYAFYNCSSLRFVTLLDGIVSIGSCAFYGCSSLEGIVIPSTITEIESSAFSGCNMLKSVYYTGTESQWNTIEIGGTNTPLTGSTIYYYSDTTPATNGNFWHYDADGNPVVW